jgi:hypothetical protein
MPADRPDAGPHDARVEGHLVGELINHPSARLLPAQLVQGRLE